MSKYTGTFPDPKTPLTNAEVIDNMLSFAKKYAADDSYKYRKWSDSNKYTHQCPLCKPESNKHATKGWNCRGFAAAVAFHGGGIKTVSCSCKGLGLLSYPLKKWTLANWKKENGPDWARIYNDGKELKISQLQNGDILILFDENNIVRHVAVLYDKKNKKVVDATSSAGISIRKPSSYGLVAFRYTGIGSLTRAYFKEGDKGTNVKQWQKFLNWYIGKDVLTVDGDFGSSTLKYTKQFQTEMFGAKEADGLVGKATIDKAKSYEKDDGKKPYPGKLPTTKLTKTNKQVIEDTVAWAEIIAKDNRFHYGKGEAAHKNGCYFCGTQPSAKKNAGILDYKFTYCCNPLIGAAWAHGGCVPAALKLCKEGRSWGFKKGEGYDKSSLFTNLGKPKQSTLKAGDVLCKDNHVSIYVGNGYIVEASGGDDNKRNSTKWNNSISKKKLSATKYLVYKRVHRFNGKVNTTCNIEHGEYSDRVALWKEFLNWYFGEAVVKVDKFYDDDTLKYTKKFQEAEFGKGQGDGIIGSKTLEKAKSVTK